MRAGELISLEEVEQIELTLDAIKREVNKKK